MADVVDESVDLRTQVRPWIISILRVLNGYVTVYFRFEIYCNLVSVSGAAEVSEKILVIDDEEATVQLISILLDRRGFEVIKAFRAEEGLRKAYRYQPDLVLMDIMMPDMDGWEVCRRLREMSDVPIIFLTARSDVKDVVRGL